MNLINDKDFDPTNKKIIDYVEWITSPSGFLEYIQTETKRGGTNPIFIRDLELMDIQNQYRFWRITSRCQSRINLIVFDVSPLIKLIKEK
jgi:hypothetical protein